MCNKIINTIIGIIFYTCIASFLFTAAYGVYYRADAIMSALGF